MGYRTHQKSINLLMLAFLSVGFQFLLQGRIGLNLWDEGFLWYGVQRVFLGEVPLRDFMSYDPGRYYWISSICRLLGDDSLLNIRLALALFQVIGLYAGLLVITKNDDNLVPYHLVFITAVLLIWMFPRHKVIGISWSLLLVYTLTRLVKHPDWKRHFFSGLFVGFAAFFGRNHGLYGVLGSIGVLTWIHLRPSSTSETNLLNGLSAWAIGCFAGYSPLLLMLVFVPDFGSSFLDSVLFQFQRGSTNMTLPLPLPWLVDWGSLSFGLCFRKFLIGVFFLLLILYPLISILYALFFRIKNVKVPAAIVATAFLSLPYAHYAYSRADVAHIAQGIFPCLVGCSYLFYTRGRINRWGGSFLFLAASLMFMVTLHPGWNYYSGRDYTKKTIDNNEFYIDAYTFKSLSTIENLIAKYPLSPEETFIAAPYWPGVYAYFRVKSPMWANYALWPRSQKFQMQEIERIKKFGVKFIVIIDTPLDGRDEMRFSNTNSYIFNYIEKKYRKDIELSSKNIHVFH